MTVRVDLQGSIPQLCGEVDDAANQFLQALSARGLSKATLRAYAFDLLAIYRWLNEHGVTLGETTHQSLLEFINHQRASNARPASINRRLMTFELVYRFATGASVPSCPATSLPAPYYRGPGRDRALGLHRLATNRALKLRVKLPHTLVAPLTPEQVRAFVETLRRFRDLSIVHLMLLCGLRSLEVRHLKWHDVDLANNMIRIHGKGNRQRMMPLPATLVSLLKRYVKYERPHAVVDDHLFVVLQGPTRGHPMTESGLRSLFRHRRQHNDMLRSANAHRFRHTFGTDMARARVPLAMLQRMMGHASAKTTLGYINLSNVDIAQEFNRVIDAIEKRYREHDDSSP